MVKQVIKKTTQNAIKNNSEGLKQVESDKGRQAKVKAIKKISDKSNENKIENLNRNSRLENLINESQVESSVESASSESFVQLSQIDGQQSNYKTSSKKQSRDLKKQLERKKVAFRKRDIIVTKTQQALQDVVMNDEQKQAIIKCVQKGFNSCTDIEKDEIRNTFVGKVIVQHFMRWIESPSMVKRDELDLLGSKDFCILIAETIQDNQEWAESHQVTIVSEFLEQLQHVNNAQMDEILLKVSDRVLKILLANYSFFLAQYSSPCTNMLKILIKNQMLREFLPKLLEHYSIVPSQVHNTGKDIQLLKGFKKTQDTYKFYAVLLEQYPGLSVIAIKFIFNNPDMLMYHNILQIFDNQHHLIQELMVKIYSVINDQEEHLDACKIITSCLKRKSELAEYITKKANGEKIDSEKMATILNVMSDSDYSKWDKLLEGGLINIARNLSDRLKQDYSKNFNTEEIKQFYDRIMVSNQKAKVCEDDFKQIFNQLTQIPQSQFQNNLFQILVACEMYSYDANKHVAALVAPGDGKTGIFISLVNKHVEIGQDVVVVVINNMLHGQMTKDLEKYCDMNKVSVCLSSNLTKEKVLGKVVMLDEVDEMIQQDVIHCSKVNEVLLTKGIHNIQYASRTYMMSATMESFHELFLLHILNMSKDQIFHYPSQYELHNQDDHTDSKIVKELHKSEDTVKISLAKLIQSKGKDSPIIVFVEEKEAKFDGFLKTVCGQNGVMCKLVDTDIQANQVRDGLAECGQAVIRVTRKFERGYDLKLMNNSIVVVIANGERIRYSEVRQMFGRGCRRQGKSLSVIMMVNKEAMNSNQMWNEIKQRKFHIVGEASKNLKPLIKALDFVESNYIDQVLKAYNQKAWQISEDDFNNQNQSLLRKFLRSIETKNKRNEVPHSQVEEQN